MSKTFAVIPAAGKSTRMGCPKLLLPLGEHTVLERVIGVLRQAGVEQVLVVVGPSSPTLAELAGHAGAEVLVLAQETPDMRSTVVRGLKWLEERFHPRDDDAWLLVPADHPALDCSAVRQLLSAGRDRADRSIVIPVHQGQRGHPAWIRWRHVPAIQTLPEGVGLNVFLRQRAAETLELPLDSPGILVDLDTPADYQRLWQNWPG